ncbi:EpsG family protein [Campylobacter ureolyticus]|uniref:EpsG family protein n=1 Tax=Campylobacter ureolyticus TaxID=827 RepID=UPI0022B3D320|nr:EpsG family protein [Campylobacter ureolyticus]MCZ6111939.1 EpsG family protein [Campylobacter ureolyticus]
MLTVIFYSLIVFLSTFFIFISDRAKYKSDKLFLIFLSFITIFIPSAIRYDIGTDYGSYIEIYNNLEEHEYIEKGFYYLNKILLSINADSQLVIIISSFIYFYICYISYPKKNRWLIHFVFVLIFWFPSFNIIRQTIAIAFSFMAIYKFFDKKYLQFITIIFLGSLFHQSILLIGIAGVASLIPLSDFIKNRIFPKIFILIILVMFYYFDLITNFANIFLNIFGLERYLKYFDSSVFFVKNSNGLGIVIFTNILFCIYVLLQTKNILKINKNYWFLIILIFICALALILSKQIIIFDRISILFRVSIPISILILLEINNKKIFNKFVVLFFVFILLIFFIKNSFGIKTDYADPKINPYKTILLKGDF